MRERIEQLIEELRDLKAEGLTHITVDETSLEALQKCACVDAFAESVSPIALPSEAPSPQHHVRTKQLSQHEPLPPPPQVTLPEGDKPSRYAWLREKVLTCPVCNAHVKSGKKVVIGSGNLDSPIFFCGEAPGAEEEIQGEVFVGPAGQLLTKIIQAMGLRREEVYIGNIMNWRPEVLIGNRPPTQEEMHYCLPYLRAQLEIVQPKAIVALGKTAVDGLLGPDSKRRMSTSRGRWHTFEGLPLMITFHPSYLLRNNTLKTKRLVWEDMLKVMERLQMSISDKQRGFFSVSSGS